MSISLKKRFCDTPEELDCPLQVDIPDDRPVRVLRVHQSCILGIFSVTYSIDLGRIPLYEKKVIVGMDWIRIQT